jgi:hypothetical protein
MRDPFLCPDCQKLGYCRKYNTKKLERTFDESEQAFFLRVNKPATKVDQENRVVPVKLISLEKMRAQFRNQAATTTATSIQIPINTPAITSPSTLFSIPTSRRTRFKQPKNVPTATTI